MLLTPQDLTFNLKNPPRLVLGLCLLLALIFGLWHGADTDRQAALDQLYTSRLLAQEWPNYDTYLLQKGQATRLKELQADYARKDYTEIAHQLGADKRFAVDDLEKNGKDYMDGEAYSHWFSARQEYNPEHAKLSAYALGLNPQQFRPITFITYQLVPQHPLPLLINIVLLIVAGMALELVLGGGPVLAAYLLSGVLGGLVFAALNSGSVFPLATASVGTAGVVGMFVMQFREQRLKLMGSSLLLSAWVVVGIWLTKEAVEFLLDHESVTILIPHLAGFAGGVGVWFAFKRWFYVAPDAVVIEEPTVDLGEIYREQLDQALQAISRMDFVDAKKRLREIVKAYPQDLRALEQLYQVEKLEPATDTFEAVTRRLFNLSNTDEAAQVCLSIYRDYSKTTQTERALDTDTCLKLVLRFARLGEVKEAEKLMKLVMSKQKTPGALLAKAAHALAQAYDRLQDPARAAFYKEMAGAT